MITKRQLLSAACAGSLASIMPSGARAQLGQATAHLMVGFGAGGAIDVVARMLVEEMKGHSSFIVENRPGAGGQLVLGTLKNGLADGSAMVLTPASMLVVFPHVYKALGYDALRDFAPVTRACSFPFLITVGPMVPLSVTTPCLPKTKTLRPEARERSLPERIAGIDQVLSTHDVEQITGKHRCTIWRWVLAGTFPPKRAGGGRGWLRSDVERWLQGNERADRL